MRKTMEKTKRIFIFGILASIALANLSAYSFEANEAKKLHHRAGDELSGTIFNLIGMLWFIDNIIVTFDDYPYADGRYLNFLSENTFSTSSDSYSGSETVVVDEEGNLVSEVHKEQFYRFALETGFFYFPLDNIYGNETRFEGYFYKFFGPVFEHSLFGKNNAFAADTFTSFGGLNHDAAAGNLKFGGQISLIHSNFFDASCHFQWAYWYGNFRNQNDLHGFNFGLILRSYPVKPVLIEWRFNWQSFGDYYSSVYDSHLELGFMLNSPLEIYAAWKYRSDSVFLNSDAHGFAAGIKYHF